MMVYDKQYHREYYLKHREKKLKQAKENREKNKESIKEYQKQLWKNMSIEDKQAHLDDREMKLKLTVHAEKNMIYNAVEHGVELEGSTVYIWGLPTCEECWKGLVQVGVSRVVMPDIEFNGGKWKKGCEFAKEYMEKAGIDVTEYLMGFINLQD